MKLQTIQATATKTGTGGRNNEDSDARLARMRAFWQDTSNAVLYPIGRLLALAVAGKTLAEHLLAGESIELETVTAPNGVTLPLKNTVLALKSPTWLCPACKSAHGTGIAPSKKQKRSGLEQNEWYYNPATQTIFVISNTCRKVYCTDLGVTDKRFPAAPTADPIPVTAGKRK